MPYLNSKDLFLLMFCIVLFWGAASSVKLGRLSIGSAKVARSGLDDLLSSTDGGKHDYDWLLTPPETPLRASSDGSDSLPSTAVPRSSSFSRSRSATTKASRLSVSQSETSHTTRPARSSSVTRSSISTSQFSTYSSNRPSSILNTSSASLSSYIRSSSPVARSARPSTPSRSSTSRSSTPSRIRVVPASSSVEKPRATQSSRPLTPSSRPQIPGNSSVPSSRSNSRASTPARRNSAPPISQSAAVSSISVGQAPSNGRSSAPTSRPSSPSPRLRPPPQPIVPPGFPMETPPNLRTTLPDRPLSAGRSRPAASVTSKGNTEPVGVANMPRRQPSPIITRGRLSVPEPMGRNRVQSHTADLPEHPKAPHLPEFGMKKPVKTLASAHDTNGYGRTASKKSLDVTIKHMDIRGGTGNLRALSNTTLFPQSTRPAASKSQSIRSINGTGNLRSGKDALPQSGSWTISSPESGILSGKGDYYFGGMTDIYESSRYDAILLKEDLNNTNWLHGVDDKSDQGSIFGNGFEPLPEPFGPL
ncbi:hypothetical protein SAY87_026983 [Trapa incisa]|uniref:Uncharacterized protein n=1 Tax=Trapa incisa TaxID=236973 RepID=A0AAN7H1Y8_9MYRT|nr:hypothetical protein SAY87_026983 [Trapa incisa]